MPIYTVTMLGSFVVVANLVVQTLAPPASSGLIRHPDFPVAMQRSLLAGTARLTSLQNDIGTAAIVAIRDGTAYLLTAKHVVDSYSEFQCDFFPHGKRYEPARVKAIDRLAMFGAIDVAVIKVTLKGLTDDQLRGLTVVALPKPYDRPRQFPVPAISVGCDSGAAPTMKAETIKAKQLVRKTEGSGAVYWLMEHPPVGGRSGGPLIDRRGKLLGICVAAKEGVGYFAYLDEIHAALKADGLAWLWESKK